MLINKKLMIRRARLLWDFLVHEELPYHPQISLLRRFKLLRHGFLSKWWEIYNLDEYKLEDYFSDWKKVEMGLMYDKRNERAGYPYGLNNKIFSTALLGQHVRVPAIYGEIERGNIIPLNWKANCPLGISWKDTCQAAGGALILKPTAGQRGDGIFFIRSKDDQLTLNGQTVSEEAIQKHISNLDEYMITEFIKQGNYATELYSNTTNTVRAVSIIEPEASTPHLLIAVQRIGSSFSGLIDNLTTGGVCAEINLETGILGQGAICPAPDYHLTWHDRHPDTNNLISGVSIPNWKEVKRQILTIHLNLAYFKLLSLDLIIGDDGDINVIEADTVSGIHVLQIHRPLLTDSRFVAFLKFHGVLD